MSPFLKIAGAIVGILTSLSLLGNIWQYVNTSNLETSLSKEVAKVVSLEKDNARLENNERISKLICKAEQDALKQRLIKSEELRESYDQSRKALSDIKNRGKLKDENIPKDGINNPIDSDIARVLNDACREVYGQTCPNPK